MYARTWASMMLYLPRSDEHASLPIERGKSPQTCHLLSSNKALFVWFWSPNLMDFLMARLPKKSTQPNQSFATQLLQRCKVHTMFLMQHDLTVWSMPLDETSTRWNKVGGDFGVPRVFFYERHPSKEAGFAKWYDRAEMALECGVLDCDWESTLSSST